MVPEFTVAWGLWLAAAVGAEIVGAPVWVWRALLGVLACIEGLALVRRRPGDTGSEHVWWWTGDRPGRRAMGAVLGLWVSYRFYAVTVGGVGPGLLSLALAAWLVPHFASEGRTG